MSSQPWRPWYGRDDEVAAALTDRAMVITYTGVGWVDGDPIAAAWAYRQLPDDEVVLSASLRAALAWEYGDGC